MKLRFIAIVVLGFTLLAAAGCGKTGGWNYDKTISQPVSGTSSAKPITIGSLDRDEVAVAIPGGTFDKSTKVTVSNPDSAPTMPDEKMTPVGSPVEIKSGVTRLNRPIVVTVKIDEAQADDLRTGSIWGAYFNGKSWEPIKPRSFDAGRGTISFHSYHMSLFGTAKIDAEEQISQFVHSQAVGAVAQDNIDEILSRNIKDNVENILKDQLGMDDESTRFKIISSLINDDEYGDIVDKLRSGDAAGFNQDFQVFVGKKIAEEAGEGVLKDVLENISGDEGVGYLEAFSQAAGFIAEKDFQSAGEVIAQQIADNSTVAQLFKASAEIVQYNIDLWQEGEIEAAYQVYKNGSEDSDRVYDVDKGDFNGLYNQMKGLSVKIEGDYIRREQARRKLLSMRPMTDAEMDKVRTKAQKDLETLFKTRAKNDADVEKEAERMKKLVAKFKEAKLLEDGSFGYDADNDTLDDRLKKLYKLTQRILRDTKRSDWSTSPFTNEKTLSVNDMTALMQAWFSDNGKAKYAKMLAEKFGDKKKSARSEGATGEKKRAAKKGAGFTLVSTPPSYHTEGGLIDDIDIEVRGTQVFASANQPRKNLGSPGQSWVEIKGTYDPKTETIDATYKGGWDGHRGTGDQIQDWKIVFTGKTHHKVNIKFKDDRITFDGTVVTEITGGKFQPPKTSTPGSVAFWCRYTE